MQKKINQILEGNFDYESGSLDFSCSKIEIFIKKGEVYEGSFRVYAPPERFSSGSIVSSDLRMEVITDEFIGSEEEIFFRFHGEKLEEGEVIKGNFYVLSNQGEYYLPFVVSVEHKVLMSSAGPIRNLFHFANLAKANWREALELFYSPEFITVFDGTDSGYKDIYRALSVYQRHERNMDEFLIQVNKKQKIEFILQEEQLSFEVTRHQFSDKLPEREISIIKSGWGFTSLQVECKDEFLVIEKRHLSDADFVGNRCALPVYVDIQKCRSGKSYGEIRIFNSYYSALISVTVNCEDGYMLHSQRLNRKRDIVQLMELYSAFRNKKLGASVWQKETAKLIQKQVSIDENDIPARLFQSQLLITEGSVNEAGWILDHVADLLVGAGYDDTLHAYYLYLTTLVKKNSEYINQVSAELEMIYRKNVSNWRVAWLLLYLSENYSKSASAKWLLFAGLFESGCISPVIYQEAVALLNTNPSLLQQFEAFEIQVLWYGARYDLLKPEVVEQILGIMDRMRGYSQVMYRVLGMLYDKTEDVRILQNLCSLLIRGNRIGESFFRWYRLGVEKKLRITNLYEYFLLSLNLREVTELSKEVLLYFSYQCNLDYERTAYLYHYVLKNADKLGEIPDVYRPRMETFCVEQIKKLHINKHLGFIYSRILRPDMITEEMYKPLSYLAYAHGIQVDNPRFHRIFVYQSGNRLPEEYQITDGRAWIALYGSENLIVFEDGDRNRFMKSVDYTLEKLTITGKLTKLVSGAEKENPQLRLLLAYDSLEGISDNGAAERIRVLLESDFVDEGLRGKLRMRLMQYYFDKDYITELTDYLEGVDFRVLSPEMKNEYVRYVLLCGRTDLAERLLNEYGPYFLDTKLLIKLLTPILEANNMVENPVHVAAAFVSFKRGKYDATILIYLMRYYKGLTKTLRDIWKAAKEFELDCYVLDERLLVQMLYSGAFVGEKMDIFRDYLAQGSKADIEYAFLTQCASEYFTRYLMTDTVIFDELLRMHFRGEKLNRVCILALVKYYAENQDEMTPEIAKVMSEFLHSLLNDEIYLECFRSYKKDVRVVQEMADKTIIEYNSKPGTRVCIHYVIAQQGGGMEEYMSEYMREVYRGVYFKKFILFFGESLQYYITEETDGGEQLTESSTVQKSDIVDPENESRFSAINDIVISKALEDYDTMEHLMDDYYMRDYIGSRLFTLR